MQRATVWASLVLQLLAASAAFAECLEIGPICQHLWQHDLVFDGIVTRIDRAITFDDEGRRLPDHRLVTYQVHEVFRGAVGSRVELLESSELHAHKSALGRRYLIQAFKSPDGLLVAAGCGASLRYEEAASEMAYLRSLRFPLDNGRIFGRVMAGPRPDRKARLVDTTVALVGGGLERTLRSNRGRYEFQGLPSGTFEISVAVPSTLRSRGEPLSQRYPVPVSLFDRRACAVIDVVIR